MKKLIALVVAAVSMTASAQLFPVRVPLGLLWNTYPDTNATFKLYHADRTLNGSTTNSMRVRVYEIAAGSTNFPVAHSNLFRGVTNHFALTAVVRGMESELSNEYATFVAAVPAPPTLLRISEATNNFAVLKWDFQDPEALLTMVQWKNDRFGSRWLNISMAKDGQQTAPVLRTDGFNQYRLVSYSPYGKSTFSSVLVAKN